MALKAGRVGVKASLVDGRGNLKGIENVIDDTTISSDKTFSSQKSVDTFTRIVELWTNDNTSSEFTGKTIQLDSQYINCKYYEVIFRQAIDTNIMLTSGLVSSALRCRADLTENNTFTRRVSMTGINNGSLEFGDAVKQAATSTSATIDNKYMIPYKVIGYL